MSVREQLEQLERLSQVATLAGLKVHVNEEAMRVEAVCGLDGGRSQAVYMRFTAKDPEGNPVVTLFSPCLRLKKGMFSGISKQQATDLLMRNERMLFARYGLWTSDKEEMIVASVDHLLDTLDPAELKASMFFVAVAADSYEKEHGKDEY